MPRGTQLTLDGALLRASGKPGWDDVHAGTARLVDRREPCDRCGMFGLDAEGRCLNTPDRYARPCNQGDGTCVRHYIEWV